MYKKEVVQKEIITDIICDCCGASTQKVDTDDTEESSTSTCEYATLEASWGYWSGRDGTRYTIHLCEECSEKVEKFLLDLANSHNRTLPINNIYKDDLYKVIFETNQ